MHELCFNALVYNDTSENNNQPVSSFGGKILSNELTANKCKKGEGSG